MRIPRFRIYLPLLAALFLLWAIVAAVLVISLRRNGGQLVYAIDDAYIHMAIAKNIVRHGVWGVTPHEFVSASSSYLWTCLLSLCYVFTGVAQAAPFALNLLFASLLLVFARELLGGFPLPAWYVSLILVMLILVTPLVPLIFGGMEHTLHALLFILFVFLVSRELSAGPAEPRPSAMGWIYGLAPAIVLARFESLAVLAVTAVLFVLRRRPRAGVTLAVLGILAVLIPGLLSRVHGGFILPNSVVLKSDVPFLPADLSGLLMTLVRIPVLIARNPYMGAAIAIAVILFVWRRRELRAGFWDQRQILLLVFVAATLLHLQYGRCGWLYRYEAYLVALGIVVIMAGGYEFFTPVRDSGCPAPALHRPTLVRARIAVAVIFIAGFIPYSYSVGTGPRTVAVDAPNLCGRIFFSLRDLPVQTTNIYQQQVQMGRFLRRYYDDARVVANDIGAITYFSNIHLLDLIGLGSSDMASIRLAGKLNAETIGSAAESRGSEIAILYEHYFRDYLPRSWIPVGQWKIYDNRICAGDTVTFYAVTEKDAERLKQNLLRFTSELPQTPTPVDSRFLW